MEKEELRKACLQQRDYVVRLRREFHRDPEVSMREYRTLDRICQELEAMELPYERVPNGGILAYICGKGPGKTVLLRADCDALPQQESAENAGGKPKGAVSQRDGVAHTCGHDAHTAMLLGACRILAGQREHFTGNIVAVFERGEENCEGYYYLIRYFQEKKMQFDSVFALHVSPDLPAGTIGICPDKLSGGNIQFEYTLTGQSGHASRPDLSVNPIDCFVAIANDLRAVRMNCMDPFHTVTYTFGSVVSGNNRNIIPEELTFKGTCRFLDIEAGLVFKEEMSKIVEKNCALYGCSAKDIMLKGPLLPGICYRPSAELASRAFQSCTDARIVEKVAFLGSESFAITLAYYPGCLAWIGIGNAEAGISATLHNIHFDIDESALTYGVAAHVAYALAFLESGFDAGSFHPNTLPIETLQTEFMCRPIPNDYDAEREETK